MPGSAGSAGAARLASRVVGWSCQDESNAVSGYRRYIASGCDDVLEFTEKTHTDEKRRCTSKESERGPKTVRPLARTCSGSSQMGEVKPTYLVTEFRAVDEEWASVRGLRGEHGARDRPGSAASPRKYLKVVGCMWGGSAALPRECLKVVGCVLRMA